MHTFGPNTDWCYMRVNFRLERLLLVTLSRQISVKSHKNGVTGTGFKPTAPLFWPIAVPRATEAVLLGTACLMKYRLRSVKGKVGVRVKCQS